MMGIGRQAAAPAVQHVLGMQVIASPITTRTPRFCASPQRPLHKGVAIIVVLMEEMAIAAAAGSTQRAVMRIAIIMVLAAAETEEATVVGRTTTAR